MRSTDQSIRRVFELPPPAVPSVHVRIDNRDPSPASLMVEGRGNFSPQQAAHTAPAVRCPYCDIVVATVTDMRHVGDTYMAKDRLQAAIAEPHEARHTQEARLNCGCWVDTITAGAITAEVNSRLAGNPAGRYRRHVPLYETLARSALQLRSGILKVEARIRSYLSAEPPAMLLDQHLLLCLAYEQIAALVVREYSRPLASFTASRAMPRDVPQAPVRGAARGVAVGGISCGSPFRDGRAGLAGDDLADACIGELLNDVNNQATLMPVPLPAPLPALLPAPPTLFAPPPELPSPPVPSRRGRRNVTRTGQ